MDRELMDWEGEGGALSQIVEETAPTIENRPVYEGGPSWVATVATQRKS